MAHTPAVGAGALPFFDIQTEIEGRVVEGAYSIVLGDLVVYYHGRTSSVRRPESGLQQHAEEMLGRLAAECYVDPEIVPHKLRSASIQYVNSDPDENEDAVFGLVEAFGESPIGSDDYRRVAFLCLNALAPLVPIWKHLADDDAVERRHADLSAWLQGNAKDID